MEIIVCHTVREYEMLREADRSNMLFLAMNP